MIRWRRKDAPAVYRKKQRQHTSDDLARKMLLQEGRLEERKQGRTTPRSISSEGCSSMRERERWCMAMNRTAKNLLSLQSFEFDLESSRKSSPVREKKLSVIRKLRSRLSMQILHEYDYRKRRFGPESVVALEDGICTGCRVLVSQQTCQLSHYRPTECEHCGRLLYNASRRKRIHFQVCAA